MHTGMINSASSARTQRELADVLLKPPLANVDLLNWQAFDRAIQAGYDYARLTLEGLPDVPRLTPVTNDRPARSSLIAELERRMAAASTSN